MNDLISVAVPIYNVAATLDQALSSIKGQTHRNLEILCVNDGSTDNSLDILQQHAAQDSRIRIIDKPNGGYSSACNAALQAASGTWLALVEPDDWIDPAMYADMLSFADALPTPPDIVKTPYLRVINPDTAAEFTVHCHYKGRLSTSPNVFPIGEHPALLRYHPSIWSAIYRVEFLHNANISFAPIPGAAWTDNLFLFDCMSSTDRIAYLDRAYYHYREETSDKTAKLHEQRPEMPFTRWLQEADILTERKMDDRRVWSVLTEIGFVYLQKALDQGSYANAEVQRLVELMFSRMQPQEIAANPRISGPSRQLYSEYLRQPVTSPGAFACRRETARDLALFVRNNGIANTYKTIFRRN